METERRPEPSGFVVAAFSIDSEKSLLYTKNKTMKGLLSNVERAVERGADYISLRIIRKKGENND